MWHSGGSNFVHHTFLDILDGFLLLPWLHFTVALNGLGWLSPKNSIISVRLRLLDISLVSWSLSPPAGNDNDGRHQHQLRPQRMSRTSPNIIYFFMADYHFSVPIVLGIVSAPNNHFVLFIYFHGFPWDLTLVLELR